MLPGKEMPHRVAEFRGSVVMQRANGPFKGCSASQCLGRPELNTSHLTDPFGYSMSGASCTRRALCATRGLHFQEIGPLSVGHAKQTFGAMLKSMVDPGISIQHTRRKNTLSAVKCSDKRAKSRTPVPQDVSKKGNVTNGVVLLLELSQEISLSHASLQPAPHGSWF